MNITIAAKLMELYAACPKCGCEIVGNGKGALECDTEAGFFRRSCGCGWCVEVTEGIVKEALAEDPPELPAKGRNREAADRIANMNTHILALQKEIENLHMDRLPETATQPKTDLKPDTQTVKTP